MIYIVVRQTTAWADERLFRSQIPEAIRETVELWNATFEMPYHLFRYELTRIAQLNWSRVAGAVCRARDAVPGGALVVPTDDDDWFSPHMAEILEARAHRRFVGWYWPSHFIEVPLSFRHRLGLMRRALFPSTPPKWLCTTNNYAVSMAGETAALLDNHMQASRWFESHSSAVVRLEEPLSLMNRTLASQTTLWSIRSRPALVCRFHQYRTLYEKEIPAGLEWCAPYRGMMAELMARLKLRARGRLRSRFPLRKKPV